MKIKVTPEGRDGVWIPEKESLVDFLTEYDAEYIHNFIQGGNTFLGCDWEKQTVIDRVRSADRLAVLTGDSWRNNMRHALSVILVNKLYMFDIGELSEADLTIGAGSCPDELSDRSPGESGKP